MLEIETGRGQQRLGRGQCGARFDRARLAGFGVLAGNRGRHEQLGRALRLAFGDRRMRAGLRHLGGGEVNWSRPAMFCSPDVGHKCLRWVLNAFGRLPKEVPVPGSGGR